MTQNMRSNVKYLCVQKLCEPLGLLINLMEKLESGVSMNGMEGPTLFKETKSVSS